MMRAMVDRAAPIHPGRVLQCFDHFVIDLRSPGRACTYFTVYAVEYSPELGTGHVAFLRLRGDDPADDLDLALTDAPEMARRMQARLLRMLARTDMSRGTGGPAELEQEPALARFQRLPWTDEGAAWHIERATGHPLQIEARWSQGEPPFWGAAMAGTFAAERDILGMLAAFGAATVHIDGRQAPGEPFHDPWWEPRLGRPFSSCHVGARGSQPDAGRIRLVGRPGVTCVHVTQIFSLPSGDPAEMADPHPGGRHGAGHAPVVRPEQDVVQPAHGAAAADPGLRAGGLAAGTPGLAGPAAGRGPGSRVRGRERGALLGDRHGHVSRPAVWENAHNPEHPSEPTTAPMALAGFGGDFSGIRCFAERDHSNIVRWTMYDHGGRFAANKAPELLVDDIREFSDGLR